MFRQLQGRNLAQRFRLFGSFTFAQQRTVCLNFQVFNNWLQKIDGTFGWSLGYTAES